MNQWPECIDILVWSIIGARRFKFVQISPQGHVWPHPRGLNFYIVIYREMLKKSSSGNMLGGWGFRFVEIKVLAQ